MPRPKVDVVDLVVDLVDVDLGVDLVDVDLGQIWFYGALRFSESSECAIVLVSFLSRNGIENLPTFSQEVYL